MSKQFKLFSNIMIIIAASMWGIDGVLLTPSYFSTFHFYNVDIIVFIAHFIPFLVLNIFLFKKYKYLKVFTASDFTYFLLIAVFGGVIGTLSMVKALQLSQFSQYSVVILLQKLQPIFAIFLASILLKEKPTKKFYIVAVIAILSSYVLAFGLKSPSLLENNNIKACLFSLLAAFSFGSSTVFGRKVLNKYDFSTSTFYRFTFTSIIMFVIILIKGETHLIGTFVSNKSMFSLALFIAFFGLLAVFTYYYGLKGTTASTATLCELAFPLTSVILEGVLRHRVLSFVQIIAAVILISAILYLNMSKADIEEIDKFETNQ
ncbi:MAG: DMT family transporter [Sebaldella sp.]|nr:DMT family transporter [Sebaldella sp.]